MEPLFEAFGRIMGFALFLPIILAEILWTAATIRALGKFILPSLTHKQFGESVMH